MQIPKSLPVNTKTLTDVCTLAYLPGPAVGLGIYSIDHAGSQGLYGWGAAPKSWTKRKGMTGVSWKVIIRMENNEITLDSSIKLNLHNIY